MLVDQHIVTAHRVEEFFTVGTDGEMLARDARTYDNKPFELHAKHLFAQTVNYPVFGPQVVDHPLQVRISESSSRSTSELPLKSSPLHDTSPS